MTDTATAATRAKVAPPERRPSGRPDNHSSPDTARNRYDVAVIGAGQAGLAMGYLLARQGRRFVILEAAGSVGSAWRNRWDSLVLFTPRRYSALPGLAFPGDPNSYPARDDVISYLEQYSATHQLPVMFHTAVRSLTMNDGRFTVAWDGGQLQADQVVVATGPFQQPRLPSLAGQLAPEVFQLHSTGYRRPSDIPAGNVLVVGGGNTGYQIARELSGTHRVHLAIGSRQTPLPQRLLGRDLFWWLSKSRLLQLSSGSWLGKRLRQRDTLIGSSPRQLRRHGVSLRPRATAASGHTVCFADGSQLRAGAVIWATSYRPDYSWIKVPGVITNGHISHHRGITGVPGLYSLGLSWQHTRGSALLGWVEDDATFIAEQVQALTRRQRG